MANYNKQKPGHRAQLNQYLTRGSPTKVGSELRKQSLEKAIEDKTKELSEMCGFPVFSSITMHSCPFLTGGQNT